MTAAIYARVSTRDKGQTNDNQLRELRAFAERLGYTIYKEYCDQESGGTADRAQFQQVLLDAHQRRFDVVLFWSLDRFSREGVTETLNHLQWLLPGCSSNPSPSSFSTALGCSRMPSSASWPPLPSRSGCG